jgi:hypothetical protein
MVLNTRSASFAGGIILKELRGEYNASKEEG